MSMVCHVIVNLVDMQVTLCGGPGKLKPLFVASEKRW
jgi:hypothetical protein